MTEEFMENLIFQRLDGLGYITNFNTYELAFINDAYLDKLGFDLDNDDYIGKPCYQVLHQNSAPCDFCSRDRLTYSDFYHWYHHDPLTNMHFLVKDSSFEEENSTYLLRTAHDISSEIAQINELKESIYINDAIIECAKTLVFEDDFNASITNLLGVICSFGKADYTFVYERNYYTNTSSLAYTYFRKFCNFDYKIFNELPINNHSSDFEKLLREEPYIYATKDDPILSKLPSISQFLSIKGIENILIVPLKIDKLVIGVIGVINFKYSSPNFNLMHHVSTFVVNKLNTKYSRDKLKNSIHNFQSKVNLNNLIINSAKTLIDSDNDVDISVNRLLKIICDHFFGQGAFIFNRDFDKNSLYCRFEYLSNSYVNTSNWHNISYDVILEWFKMHEKNDCLYIKSVINELHDNSKEYHLLCDDQVTSFMVTPLYQKNDIVGFLWIDNPKKNFDDVEVIKSISTLVSSHISRDNLIKQLGSLSFTDALTGLYNRNFYIKYISQIKAQPRNNIGVIFADVNGLKKANDNLGHQFGDILVRWCGNFLKKHIRGFVFRIGGDEFVSFIENIQHDDFDLLISSLKNILSDYHNVHISLGHKWTSYADDIDSLIKESDELMYLDKEIYYQEKSELHLSFEQEINLLKESILQLDDFKSTL